MCSVDNDHFKIGNLIKTIIF